MNAETIILITISIIIYLIAMYVYFMRPAFKEVNDIRIRRKSGYISPSLDERMTWAAIILSGICVAMLSGLIAMIAMKFIPIVP